MKNPIETAFKSAVVIAALMKKPKSYSTDSSRSVKGILNNRDRPAGSGWCGAENCKHASHKRFNEPARS